ncbi:unnamed protein product [Ranitomeya imitator]|uniref:IF rod domain-containing protein n=1 Tax=Ranitomeya imitator TaxID=111125 RepID=A0ABN9LVE4_9NEOB|nr:unnamed protein product [Ranitomeya imitator]
MQVEGLNEEMIFLKKSHKKERGELRQQAKGAVNVEVDVLPPVDLGKIMDDMRAQYEQLAEKQKLDAKNVFDKKVSDLHALAITKGPLTSK